jgi:transposase
MDETTIIGLDIAKQIFQIHGVSADGEITVRRRLRRSEVLRFFGGLARCIVGLEACGGSHFWAREIAAFGHDVRLIPPAYVKPYVKRGKTDAVDAEAICEAVARPTMRFVPIKSAECQAALMVLKTRDLLVRQRTQAINAVRGHLAELGIVAAKGLAKVETLIAIVRDENDQRLPASGRTALKLLADQIEGLTVRIEILGREIVAEVRRDDTMRRLATIPGVGPITAATIKALVPDPGAFKSGRHFAAWIGLTPKMHSSGGKERLGKISKMGNPALRSLLVVGATAVLQHARRTRRGATISPWLTALLARRPAKVAAIALANKMARIVWALLTKGGTFIRNNGATVQAAA